jgi:hypothetical protein
MRRRPTPCPFWPASFSTAHANIRSYSPAAKAGLVPAVLLGLRESENLFVGGDGKWDARYVPAFVRRYPFVPGKGPQGDLLVCIDEASPCFSSTEGEALFVDGKPTPQLDHAMKFLAEFHQGVTVTEALARRLNELGLLRQADSVAQLQDGSQFRLNGLSVVDEAKLRTLEPGVVQELFANGSLAVVYAHLMSLGNLGTLVDRLSRRGTGAKPAAPARRAGPAPNRPSGADLQPGREFPL